MSRWALLKNAVLGVGTNFVDVPGSNAEEDVGSTAVAGGIQIDSGFTCQGTRSNTYELPFNVGDTITLAINGDINGHATQACAALRWSERL
jgi:hypothetical protein